MDFKYSDKAAESTKVKREADKRRVGQKREDGVFFHGIREKRFPEYNPRAEAFGYTNKVGRTEGNAHGRQDAIVQRMPGLPDTIIDSLSGEIGLEGVRFSPGKGVDASASEITAKGTKSIGSLYFENGRFRLTHVHGPEIGLREEIVRFAFQGNINQMVNLLRRMKGWEKADCIELLEKQQGYTMTKIQGDRYPVGRLIELYFEDGRLVTHHPSRGGMEKYTISPGDEAETEEESSEKSIEQQRRYAMEIGRVVAASQQFGAMLSQNIMTAFIEGKNDIDLGSAILAAQSAIEEMMGGEEVPGLEMIMKDENIVNAIKEAKSEANRMTQESYRVSLLKRLQGYFANQFFHVSNIAQKMRLDVDTIDMPKS